MRRAACLLALVSLAACQDRVEQRFDWLAEGEGAKWLVERTHFGPRDMSGPNARGFQRAIESAGDGRRFRWSRGGSSHFVLELIDTRQRRLVLDGVPMPHRDGRAQTVDVVIDGEWVGQLEWSERARQELPIPEGFLKAGRNELELVYGHVAKPAEHLRDSDDQRRLAMAWFEVSVRGASGDRSPDLAGRGVQRASSLLARWTPLVDGSRWSGEGVALHQGAQLELWTDPGDGRWRSMQRFEVQPGQPVRFVQELELGDGEVQRCAVAMLEGGVRWSELSTRHEAPRFRPPIVLITLDTTRRDAMGFHGDAADTPNLDRIAAESVVFEQAYTVAPVTAPTHASIFLSAYPAEHGLTINGRSVQPARGDHLLAQAQAWGYQSAGFVSLGVLGSDLGFAQEFDHFDDRFDQGWWRFASELNPHALRWVAEHPQGESALPGFLWLHYADPHKPYGIKDEVGQQIVLELDGRRLGVVPSMGLLRHWTLQLPRGRSTLRLRASRDFADAREHWYVLRDALVAQGQAQLQFGEGWTEVRGYRRMREEAVLLLDSPQAGEISLRLIVEDLPDEAEARRRYAEEVQAVDHAVGELWSALEAHGWLEHGIVMVLADHGEDLGEDGHFGHVEHVGDTLMRVPWLIWSRSLAPRRVEAPVSVIDLAPTLWSLAGLPPSQRWRGVDALGSIEPRALLLETFPPEARQHWRGVVEGDQVLRALQSEAGWVVREGGHALDQRQLGELLEQWQFVGRQDEDELGAEVEERLRALGYIR